MTTTPGPDVQEFLSRLTGHVDELSLHSEKLELFALNGVSYAACHLQAIRDLVTRAIPELVVHADRAAKALRAHDVQTFLTVDSLSESAKTEIAVCKRDGVRSVFVDHGVDGFRPAMHSADRILTDVAVNPGTFDRGDRGRTTLALGNPCFDPIARAPRRKPAKIRSLLFLGFEDTFYERLDRCAWQEKYYEEAFATFQRLSALGLRVRYRPHPANDRAYQEYLLDFFGVFPSTFEWAVKPTFVQILREVDLVVSSMSTCLYETLAAGVPAVFFDPVYREEAFFPPFSGKNFEEIIRVTSGDDLVALIESQLENPSRLYEFVRNFRARHAPAYLGPLDGLSGKRIHNYLTAR